MGLDEGVWSGTGVSTMFVRSPFASSEMEHGFPEVFHTVSLKDFPIDTGECNCTYKTIKIKVFQETELISVFWSRKMG